MFNPRKRLSPRLRIPAAMLVASLLYAAHSLFPVSAGSNWPASPTSVVEREVYLMGTRCRLAAVSDGREAALKGLERLLGVLEGSERELSTWKPDSQLSRLNRQPIGKPFLLEPRLCRLFPLLTRWHRLTGSAFDPAIGRLIEAWDIRGEGRIPDGPTLAAARRDSGLKHLLFDESACQVERGRDVLMDAGAFGKGEAIDRAFKISGSLQLGGWLADLGGQIGVWGSPPRGEAWEVSIAHPRRRQQAVLKLKLAQGSLAVSGGSERDLIVDGQIVSHIIDPRDGRPVVFRGSTVVWHSSGLASDALSTALYVMGPEKGLAWARRHDVAVCFLMPEGEDESVRIDCSPRFLRMFADSL